MFCSYCQKRAVDDIQRRLVAMSQQWEEGKVSPAVHQKMSALVRGTVLCDLTHLVCVCVCV